MTDVRSWHHAHVSEGAPDVSTFSRAWYSAAIAEFRTQQPDFILGQLSRHSTFDIVRTQTMAWLDERGAFKIEGAMYDRLRAAA